ncbi:Uncharacterised protein [Mycobacteroides abscessus subsp. bolletii]|uniref:hypothetical protein n=1 Tax=Mycobacteroides abscessus TaxID=36809 RepID=UPI0009C9E2E4|nr:hypothetical protein [Mycobacteroides abscessus]SKV05611.1 Uncharacterised protein [Mycobacteroides abscessus subsp. bolletii]
MPPDRPRADSRKRAADAYRLRCMGRTWDEIAKATGFKSHASAFNAVKKHIQRMPAEDQELARAYSAGNYRQVIAQLYEVVARARTANRHTTAVQALQAIADVQDKHDKLTGLHIAVPTKLEVNVTSAVAVLERAEADLLAIVAENPRALAAKAAQPVIDAEVVEP